MTRVEEGVVGIDTGRIQGQKVGRLARDGEGEATSPSGADAGTEQEGRRVSSAGLAQLRKLRTVLNSSVVRLENKALIRRNDPPRPTRHRDPPRLLPLGPNEHQNALDRLIQKAPNDHIVALLDTRTLLRVPPRPLPADLERLCQHGGLDSASRLLSVQLEVPVPEFHEPVGVNGGERVRGEGEGHVDGDARGAGGSDGRRAHGWRDVDEAEGREVHSR